MTLFAVVSADIAALQSRLFLMQKEMVMPRNKWEAVWPYVDSYRLRTRLRRLNSKTEEYYSVGTFSVGRTRSRVESQRKSLAGDNGGKLRGMLLGVA